MSKLLIKNLIPFFFSDIAIPEGEINLGKRLIILALDLDGGASDLEEEVESIGSRQDTCVEENIAYIKLISKSRKYRIVSSELKCCPYRAV